MSETKKAESRPGPVVLKERKKVQPFIRTIFVEAMARKLSSCKKLKTLIGEAIPIGELSQSAARLTISRAGKKLGCFYKVARIKKHPKLLQVWELSLQEVRSMAERILERQEKEAAFEKLSPAEKAAYTKKVKERSAKAKATRDKNKKKA